jgi:hypothetical protein
MSEGPIKIARPAKLFFLRSNGAQIEACMSSPDGELLLTHPITPKWLSVYGAMLMEVIARNLKGLDQ